MNGTAMRNRPDDRDPIWPPPRPDPPEEPSHPGARLEELVERNDDDADTESDT
jgi:hypothetical protein